MGSQNGIVSCPRCGAKNRLPLSRKQDRPLCGRCRFPLPLSIVYPETPVEVTDRNFKEEILDFPGPVVVDFWATWCNPSQSIAPSFDQLAGEYKGRVKFAKMNVAENRIVPSQYRIQGTPTLLFIRSGRILERLVGAHPKEEIRRHIQSLAGR